MCLSFTVLHNINERLVVFKMNTFVSHNDDNKVTQVLNSDCRKDQWLIVRLTEK